MPGEIGFLPKPKFCTGKYICLWIIHLIQDTKKTKMMYLACNPAGKTLLCRMLLCSSFHLILAGLIPFQAVGNFIFNADLDRNFHLSHFQVDPVKGNVRDAEGNPLAGVNIVVKGSTKATATDAEGNFEIDAAIGEILVVSFVGFRKTEVAITNLRMDIKLEEEAQVFSTVSVLGSRGNPRTDVNRPVPVDIIMAKELQSTGQVELGMMAKYTSPSFNTNKYYNAIVSFADPSTLRGLWPDQVLVLVDGKRRHQLAAISPFGSVGRGTILTDLNAIPALALDRIEVLRDGAAAQYGSDAIAGIINLGLKKSVGEGTFKTQFGQTKEGDGQSFMTALNYGLGLGKAGSYLNFTLHFQDSKATNRADSYTGRIYVPATQPLAREDSIRQARGVWPTTTSGKKVIVTRNGQNPITAYQGFLNAGYPVGKDMELYASGGYSKREVIGNIAYIPALAANPRSNPAIYPDGYNPELEGVPVDYSGVVGLRKTSATGWNFDLSTSYGQNSFDWWIRNTTNPSLGAASPKAFYIGKYQFGQNVNELVFSKQVEGWAGTKALNVAIGSQLRFERFVQEAGDSLGYKAGPLLTKAVGVTPRPSTLPEDATKDSRSNIGIFADLESDITDNFLVAAALRYENYSDFGSNLTGKVATRYKIGESFALRGSVNRGFRAPSTQQIYHSATVPALVSGMILTRKLLRSDDPRLKEIGITSPEAESSWNYNIGLTAKIGGAFLLTLDAYQIDIRDRIVLSEDLPVSSIAALKSRFQGFEQIAFYTNFVNTQTRGLDVVATYRHTLGPNSSLNTSLAISLNQTEIVDMKGTPAQLQAGTAAKVLVIDTVSQSLIETSQPRQRATLSLGYQYKKLNLLLRGNYFGEVTAWEKPGPGIPHRSQTFSPRTLLDASISYAVKQEVVFSIGANNLLDVYPDRVFSDYTAYNLGTTPFSRNVQQFGFLGAFYYANVTINF